MLKYRGLAFPLLSPATAVRNVPLVSHQNQLLLPAVMFVYVAVGPQLGSYGAREGDLLEIVNAPQGTCPEKTRPRMRRQVLRAAASALRRDLTDPRFFIPLERTTSSIRVDPCDGPPGGFQGL